MKSTASFSNLDNGWSGTLQMQHLTPSDHDSPRVDGLGARRQ